MHRSQIGRQSSQTVGGRSQVYNDGRGCYGSSFMPIDIRLTCKGWHFGYVGGESVYRGLSGKIGKRTQENASPSGFFPGYIGYIR